MKKTKSALILCTVLIAMCSSLMAQDNYKHPQLNSSGQVLDSTGTKLGWIKEGVIYSANGEKVGKIEKEELLDYKGHKLGKIGKDGTFYDPKGAIVFTIEPGSKGEKCKIFDPQGKVIATVHESYKNQACAIHCLYKKMPAH
ncbi:MAG: hypothetical protein OJF59_001804 [Cytophagales bacterium]|jgi:hypothetical protein|nr:hypothetical protein [Bacteroidota bacterium]MBS1980717.1 hypothetical protein [Bacteroidota bacterium]WHZ08051.1 MAG: hypothetical protein OJF59_001804 [Cytophagales bacterium]